jgi:D-aminoacyl-tRNA deacylase
VAASFCKTGVPLVNKGITLSLSDPAGQTMFPLFLEKGFKETEVSNIYRKGEKILIVIDPLLVPEIRFKVPALPRPYPVDFDALAQKYDLEYITVASRHWAKSGKPSITAHPTGNFGKAMYGGRPRELQMTFPNGMRNIYLKLLESPPETFQVSLEATHHSPTQFMVPMFFIEVGSREEQWRNIEVCEYLVGNILAGMDDREESPIAIGFGGGHYCPLFSETILDFSMGHMAAKYVIDLLTQELVLQMVQKSLNPEYIILDGLKGRLRKKVENLVEKTGLEIL